MEEDIQKSMEHITKVYDALKEITPEKLRQHYCGLCHEDLRLSGGSCGALPYQNPYQTTYHMHCHDLLRAYENHFALARLLGRTASPFHKRFLKKEVEKAYWQFAKAYILLLLQNGIEGSRKNGIYDDSYKVCSCIDRKNGDEEGTAYKKIVAELEETYTKNGWGSPRKR